MFVSITAGMMRIALFFVAIGTAFGLRAPTDKPNYIMLFVDDLGEHLCELYHETNNTTDLSSVCPLRLWRPWIHWPSNHQDT
jgi:hypothetical protein